MPVSEQPDLQFSQDFQHPSAIGNGCSDFKQCMNIVMERIFVCQSHTMGCQPKDECTEKSRSDPFIRSQISFLSADLPCIEIQSSYLLRQSRMCINHISSVRLSRLLLRFLHPVSPALRIQASAALTEQRIEANYIIKTVLR